MTTTATPYTVPSNVSSAHTSQRSMRMLLLALILTALQGCTTTSGIVVDEQGKPLKGAIVMAEWTHTMNLIVQGQSVCSWSSVTYTDANGHFTVDRHASAAKGDVGINVAYPMMRATRASNKDANRIVMAYVNGTDREKFYQLNSLSWGGCGGTETIMLPYWKMIADDLSLTAKSPDDVNRVDNLLHLIDTVQHNRQEANRLQTVREQQRKTSAIVEVK